MSATCNMRDKLLCKFVDVPQIGCNKITIIGAGRVGMAVALCILTKGITNEICLIDIDERKVLGEILDLQQGSCFIQNANITGGTDYRLTCNSRIVIIAAGCCGEPNDEPLSLLEKNAPIIKAIVPEVVKYCPRSIIIVITNPVDVMTYYTWKLSGFPKHRVLGTGTTIESARFRRLIAEKLRVGPNVCDALVIGECGRSSVPVWSGVTVSGINLRDINPCIGIADDEEGWNRVHQEVKISACRVMEQKGYANWAIGLSCAAIIEAIFNNTGKIHPVSTLVNGMYSINKDVFLSLPCSLNVNGITSIIKLNLTHYEGDQLQASANVLYEAQSKLKL